MELDFLITFIFVLQLFIFKDMLIKVVLQLLISIVYAPLFKTAGNKRQNVNIFTTCLNFNRVCKLTRGSPFFTYLHLQNPRIQIYLVPQ